ncbi:MAG: hypothetical protein CMJ58_28445 [Planctomycetaceae bacterium]|nr:hypothetical protein [Planctomycetaceae bacterium]
MEYKLPNPDGKPYDFGDPEFWESYGFTPEFALEFAKCFPEYWRDVSAWYRKYSNSFVASNYFNDFLRRDSARARQAFRSSKIGCNQDQIPLPDTHQFPYDRSSQQLALAYVRTFRNAGITPQPLPGGLKRRERLPDGAIYLGRTRLAHQEVLESEFNHKNNEQCIRWGPLLYAPELAFERHFLVLGSTRSGKTTILRLLLQSLHRNPDARCIVYDYKTDLIPALIPSQEHTISDLYHILNPYDARGAAWDIAKDVDENSAPTLSEILLPSTKHDEGSNYFTRVTRSLLTATVRALIHQAADSWTFLDLMLALQSENIRSVLATTTEGRRLYNAHVAGDGQTQQNVLSGLNECADRYVRIAAAWARADERISFRHWAINDSKGILLGNSIRNSASIKPVILCIIHFLFHELLDGAEQKPYHTFMVLDEFARLGHVPQIVDVIQAALSQRLSLVLGVHDLESVQKVYREATTSILGPCSFKAFLRNTTPETARWISNAIGEQDVSIEVRSTSKSESFSPSSAAEDKDRRTTGTSSTSNWQYLRRPAVPMEEIMGLPPINPDTGISGFFLGPGHPPYRGNLYYNLFCGPVTKVWGRIIRRDGQFSKEYLLWQESQQDPKFIPTPPEHFRPPEDSFSTLAALGFQRDLTPYAQPLPIERPTPAPIENSPPQEPELELSQHQIAEPPAGPPMAQLPKKHKLADMVWDDELETFVLRSREDDD